MADNPVESTKISSLLLCEALGFAPQLLLDDIINIANSAVHDGVNGMEEFLLKWVEEREAAKASKPKDPEPPAKGKKGKKKAAAEQEKGIEDLTEDIEQGLVSFQTLLEYHTDVAFDFFEAWSLRNVFFIPPDLQAGGFVVLPHYEGTDLTMTANGGSSNMEEKERNLMEEVEILRKRLDEQRRLTKMLKLALIKSRSEKRKADKRLNKLIATLPFSSSGDASSLDHLSTLPEQLLKLYDQTSSLPPLEAWPQANAASSQDSGSGSALTGTGKREWEVGSSGYANWAVGRLVNGPKAAPVSDGKHADEAPGTTWVDQLEQVTEYVGTARDVKAALEAYGVKDAGREAGAADAMDVES